MPVRVIPVQWLRAIAALLVIWLHACASVSLLQAPVTTTLSPAMTRLSAMGASGVDLFFAISGFVMAHVVHTTRASPIAFLRKRWWRIAPLFIVVSVIFFLIRPGLIAPDALLSSLTILPVTDGWTYHSPALTVGWTLGFEFAFYSLVAIMLDRPARRVATLLALTSAAALLGSIWHVQWAPARMLLNPLQAEFALGIGVWIAWRRGWTARFALPLTMVGAGALLVVALMHGDLPHLAMFAPAVNGTSGWQRTVAWGLPWALILAGIVDLRGQPRWSMPVAALGDASYSLYLIHPCIVVLIERLRGHLVIDPIGYVIAVIVLSALFGVVFHRCIEQPLLRWTHRSKAPPPAAFDRLAGGVTLSAQPACSARTVSPLSLTSAKPPWIGSNSGSPFSER